MTKAAALLAWVAGFGFYLPCVYAIWHFANRGQIWIFLGYPTYGEGLFENVGIKTSVPLLVSFLLVCAAELVVGWMLWRNQLAGRVCALARLPIEFAFWVGFLLPVGPSAGLARTALVLMAWSRCATQPQAEVLVEAVEHRVQVRSLISDVQMPVTHQPDPHRADKPFACFVAWFPLDVEHPAARFRQVMGEPQEDERVGLSGRSALLE